MTKIYLVLCFQAKLYATSQYSFMTNFMHN